MEIRPVRVGDLSRLIDIDGTIESAAYLHVEQSGEALACAWKLRERPLREKKMDRNPPTDEALFTLKQVASGMEDGMALLADHDGVNIALLIATEEPQNGTMRVLDVRVDYEHRRQGLGSAMLYQVISEARNRGLRAVFAESRTDNLPAARYLNKGGLDLSGLDLRRHTNHDLVKEAVTLFWYAALD